MRVVVGQHNKFLSSAIFSFIVCVALSSVIKVAYAAENSSGKLQKTSLSKKQETLTVQPVRTQLLALLTLSKKVTATKEAKQLITFKVNRLQRSKPALNDAEKYLLAIVRANVAKAQDDHQKVITLLANAEILEKTLAKKQLQQPLFFNLDWLLCQSYQALKSFDKAYEYKRKYLHKYARYTESQKKLAVESLTKKYQMQKKRKNNQLLEERNKLEKERIAQVKELKRNQQRNNVILIVIGISFVLIIFYQYRVRVKLLRLSRTDSLTGLLNRKSFFYFATQQHDIMVKQAQIYSVIYFDCDHFKAINDEFGHQIGDQVLQIVAQLGKDVIRTRDIFARLGGEEFAIILPEEDLSRAKAVAEHLRMKIADYNFTTIGLNKTVTASFGVAASNEKINDFDQVINFADAAMFQAKDLGRNRVVVYESLASQVEEQYKLTIRQN